MKHQFQSNLYLLTNPIDTHTYQLRISSCGGQGDGDSRVL